MTDLAPRPVDTGLEEVTTTRVEKFLSVVLAGFVLVGLLWAYAVPLDRTPDDAFTGPPPAALERDNAFNEQQYAESELASAQQRESSARETYRTKLDAKEPADAEQQAFEQAQRATAAAAARLSEARAKYQRLKPIGDAAEAEQNRVSAADYDRADRETFGLRAGFTVVVLGASFFGLDRARRRRSRAVQPWMGVVGAGSLLAIVMAADYLELDNVGPIALSLFGTVLTVSVIVAYQRWLAARLPERRARKHECPWCGYPTGDGVPHCEGCGREVVAACTACSSPRRAGVRYCGACGATA